MIDIFESSRMKSIIASIKSYPIPSAPHECRRYRLNSISQHNCKIVASASVNGFAQSDIQTGIII